jgi:hypothetical protein
MSEGRRGGERRQHARPSACTRRRHERSSHALRDASFARSFDPCASILTMHRKRKLRWWGGRGGITVEQARATEEKQHWGLHERTKRGSPGVTASARKRAWHARKGRRSRPPSLRESRARVWLLARRCLLQKSAGDVWSRIRSANALQKGRQGRVNRDLALRGFRRVKPQAAVEGRNDDSPSPDSL